MEYQESLEAGAGFGLKNNVLIARVHLESSQLLSVRTHAVLTKRPRPVLFSCVFHVPRSSGVLRCSSFRSGCNLIDADYNHLSRSLLRI